MSPSNVPKRRPARGGVMVGETTVSVRQTWAWPFCPCGCRSGRGFIDSACARFVRDFGAAYRSQVNRQRVAEGRAVAA